MQNSLNNFEKGIEFKDWKTGKREEDQAEFLETIIKLFELCPDIEVSNTHIINQNGQSTKLFSLFIPPNLSLSPLPCLQTIHPHLDILKLFTYSEEEETYIKSRPNIIEEGKYYLQLVNHIILPEERGDYSEKDYYGSLLREIVINYDTMMNQTTINNNHKPNVILLFQTPHASLVKKWISISFKKTLKQSLKRLLLYKQNLSDERTQPVITFHKLYIVNISPKQYSHLQFNIQNYEVLKTHTVNSIHNVTNIYIYIGKRNIPFSTTMGMVRYKI